MKFQSYLAALVFLPLSLNAQNLNDKLSQLQKVGDDFAGATAMGTSTPAMKGLVMEQREFSNNFGSVQSYVQQNNYEQAIRTLQRWLQRTQNAQVKAALEELLKSLKEEQAARVVKLTTRVDEVLQAVGKKLSEAKTTEKVTSIQTDLGEFRDTELGGGDPSTRALNERLNRAINFINAWQQVLVNESNGEYADALQSLNSLRRNSNSAPLLSSELIAAKYQSLLEQYLNRDTTEKDPTPITQVIATTMAKVKSPADAANAAAIMTELNRVSSGTDNRLASTLQNQLSELVQIQSDIDAGSFSRAFNSSTYSNRTDGQNPYLKQITDLRDALRREALAAAVNGLSKPKEEGKSPLLQLIATTMAKVKTPADAAEAQATLATLGSLGIAGDSRLINAIQNQLNEVVQMEANFQAGSYATLINNSGNFNNAYGKTEYTKQLQALKSELRRQALAAVVSGEAQSNSGEGSTIREMIATIMAKVKTPADAATAYAAVSELSSLGISGNSRLLSAVQNQLNEVAQMDSDYQAGAFAKVINGNNFGSSYGPTPYTKQLQVFKDELRARAVAAANDLPNLGTPKVNESFPAFVRRLAGEAYEKKEWESLHTLLTVYSTVSGGGCARTDDMQAAVDAYISGTQLEAVQLFGDAVLKYTYCISKLGKLVPRTEATTALERLRREHPEAFAPTGNLR